MGIAMTLRIDRVKYGYAVFRGEEKISGTYKDEDFALERRDKIAESQKARVRPCLKCRTPFQSEGPHHRMCRLCRRGVDDSGAYGVGTLSGLSRRRS